MPFNKKVAETACNFFPKYLHHTKGRWGPRKGKLGERFELLPWQMELVSKLFGTLKADGSRQYNTVYCEIPKKNGKALACDTPIPTPDGWIQMGDLQIGDKIFANTGKQCKVLAVSEIMVDHPCYILRFGQGYEIIADAEHLWETETYKPWMKRGLHTTTVIRQTRKYQLGNNHKIHIAGALEINNNSLFDIDPYVLGAWLGDGVSANASIINAYRDYQIIEEINKCGVETYEWKSSNKNSGQYHLGKHDRTQAARNKSIQTKFREMHLLHNKHIPSVYLRGNIKNRFALLQGLMDTDGYIPKTGQCEFTTTNEKIRDGIYELIVSLNMKATIDKKRATLYGKDCGPKYRIRFSPNGNKVFRLKRKLMRQKKKVKWTRAYYRKIISVEPIDPVPVRCIQVDNPSGQFLAGRSMIPTHNSELAAGIALKLLFADRESGAEIYSAASDRDQASIVFNVAAGMIEQNKILDSKCRVLPSTKRIIHGNGSIYRVLSSEAYSKAGYNVHGIIFDELHTQPNRDLWDVLTKGAGDARRQPVFFAITTAGYDRTSICWEVHEYALAVKNGEIIDPTFLPIIHAADPKDDWTDEKVWYGCNPSLEKIIDIEKVRNACEEAKSTPANENMFKRLRLNIWTEAKTLWITSDKWQRCNTEPVDPEKLIGRKCYGGLDLSTTIDISAWSLCFPPEEEGEKYQFLHMFFIPLENMTERELHDKVSYSIWIRDGFVMATAGDAIDYAFIEDCILKDAEKYNIQEIDADPHNAQSTIAKLQEEGMTVVPARQGFISMNPMAKDFEIKVLNGKLAMGNNPVMNWMIRCCEIITDPAGNIKPVKPSRQVTSKHIDGVISSILALYGAVLHEQPPSVYEERGVISI